MTAPGLCGDTGHPVFTYPCNRPKGHRGMHENGSGSPWGDCDCNEGYGYQQSCGRCHGTGMVGQRPEAP